MQYVIISGKGGTGKTTLAASFAHLGPVSLMKADCDVDASNLHLMFEHELEEVKAFKGAKIAAIDPEKCTNCDLCKIHCRFGAIVEEKGIHRVDPLKCEGCGACDIVCNHGAVTLDEEITGETRVYKSVKGIIAGASLIPGAEGSGKLVTQVRKMAQAYSQQGYVNTLIDGSPGIGCAVMASVTGCQYGIIVTEPTLSGFEDFERVHQLLNHFEIIPMVIVNKYDINLQMTQTIEAYCKTHGIRYLGQIPFDPYVERSINEGTPLVAYEESKAGHSIRKIWSQVNRIISKNQ